MRPRSARIVSLASSASSASLASLASFASFVALSCKPTAPPPPPVVTAAPAAAAPATIAEPEAQPPPPPVVYGHFRVASPTLLLAQIREQLVPADQRSMLDESSFRTLAGLGLGERSGVAQHIDLARPMGCVVTSPTRHDRPLTCVIGYDGGLDRLVEDLGTDGYVSGGDDYAAYRIDGQPLYLNAMGRHVAIAFAPDLTAATRDRLQRDIIDAPAGVEDASAAIFPGTIFEDVPEQIEQVLDQMAADNASKGPLAEAQTASQRRQLLSFGELDRADLWLDLTPERVRLGYRGIPRPGTPTEKAYRTPTSADSSLLEMLPADSFVAGSFHFDPATMQDDPMFGSYLQAMSELEQFGATAALTQMYRDSMATWAKMSTGHAAMGMLQQRGTKGGIVMLYRLKPDAKALPMLQENFVEFQRASKGSDFPVDFEFRRGGIRMGKTKGDVLTMRPNAKTQARLESGPEWLRMKQALGGPPQLQMAWAQRDDVLYMVFTVRKAKTYLQRAMAAGSGKRDFGSRADVTSLLTRHPSDSLLMVGNIGSMLDWLVRIDAMEAPPKPVGGTLDDVVISMRTTDQGQREFLLDVSQSLIDTLLTLRG